MQSPVEVIRIVGSMLGYKKVEVGKDQQSEKDSHSKNRDWKKLN